MFRVLRDGKRGPADESPDECSCVLLTAVGTPVHTPTMLSKFPATLVADWLRAQGLLAEFPWDDRPGMLASLLTPT